MAGRLDKMSGENRWAQLALRVEALKDHPAELKLVVIDSVKDVLVDFGIRSVRELGDRLCHFDDIVAQKVHRVVADKIFLSQTQFSQTVDAPLKAPDRSL